MAELVGYARVSTFDQETGLQIDALKQAGCARIFEEHASGTKTDRLELAAALDYLRPGDTLVVWRLDRLGRSLKHLIDTVSMLDAKGIGFKSVHESIDTLREALTEELIVVGAVVLIFLLHLRSSLAILPTLPLSVGMSFIVMYYLGVDSNIMSLAGIAIAIGAMVDAVIIFEEDTPLQLIKVVMPDVLVKGGGYTLDQIVGAKEVMAAGGRVVINPIVPGFSTTGIIDKICRL